MESNIDVDLFVDSYAKSQYTRFSKQIYSKKGAISGSFDEFLAIESDNPVYQKYRQLVIAEHGMERISLAAGKSTADNLYELETLGISRYRRDFMVLIDFTDVFDFIVANLSGCRVEDVQKIKNYHEVSKTLTHFSFGSLDGNIAFSDLTSADKKIELWLYKLFLRTVHGVDYKDMKLEAQRLMCIFYNEITNLLEQIKDYTAIYLTTKLNAVYRSKSFYSVILTSSTIFNGTVTLKYNGYEKVVPIRTYDPLGFPRALANGEPIYEPVTVKYKNAIVSNAVESAERKVEFG